LPAAPQKYAPKLLHVPYFTTGFIRGYKNHATSEHSRAMTAIQLSTLNQPPVIARNAAQRNDEAIPFTINQQPTTINH